MQFAKDSFYIALRDRLGALNPARTVTLNGTTRPAIVLVDNQPVTAAEVPPDCFGVSFGRVTAAKGFTRSPEPLWAMECMVSYRTCGTAVDGCDRDRALSALDTELLQICTPASTPKIDYTKAAPALLGTNVFWRRPELGEVKSEDGIMRRTAALTVFFFGEVSA